MTTPDEWPDLDAIFTDAHLDLPIRGKTYRIGLLGYQDGLRLKLSQEALEAGRLDDVMPNGEFLAMILGPALEQMHADNIPEPYIVRAGMTAHAFNTYGKTLALHMWKNGPDPEALAASMKAAAASSTTSPGSVSAGSSTKQLASTKPTRSRKAGSPKASRSRGATSSRSGRS